MKKYMNLFLNDEDGVETIEFIALVAVAAVLIGIVIAIGQKMKGTAQGAKGKIESSLEDWDL